MTKFEVKITRKNKHHKICSHNDDRVISGMIMSELVMETIIKYEFRLANSIIEKENGHLEAKI